MHNELEDDWLSFLENDCLINETKKEESITENIPKCSELYISTKTKNGSLNQNINLSETFWQIPIIDYQEAREGILKKQMKISCLTVKESKELDEKIEKQKYCHIDTITKIDDPNARKIKYKDVRKINIGLSKKDLTSFRTKKKGAFYNCFVIIVRVLDNNEFKEIHVKLFNTGKVEIPGIKKDSILDKTMELVIEILQPYFKKKLLLNNKKFNTSLVNSNFTCNHNINRDEMSKILKYKYKLGVVFDPCSYPGIQCKFYYHPDASIHNGVQDDTLVKKDSKNKWSEISFMIFRTGSVLIVGKCNREVLDIIYNFLVKIITTEYKEISLGLNKAKKEKKKTKVRKRTIIFTTQKSS
tara:strand:- start:2981 stop:4048 length:1068 start_codon:yes stop_codon:yes gene_type:complete